MNSLRCSVVARDQGLDPLGSAGSYRGFLLVEWPLPWPADLSDVPGLAPVVAALAGTGIRLQGVVPTGAAGSGDARRVALYLRPPGDDGFVRYRRTVRWVAPDDVEAAAVDLVSSASATSEPSRSGEPGGYGDPGDDSVGDLLICTHGRRDACCGSSGTALMLDLVTDLGIEKSGYRLGRTSHTGGHRFAPTAIVLPEGTMWAFLDTDMTSRVARREGPVEEVLAVYRGSTAMGSPTLQALERVAFADVGWDWLEWRRRGEALADGGIRVTGTAPDGTDHVWEATATSRTVPVPDCGKPLAEARKSSQEPILSALTRPSL